MSVPTWVWVATVVGIAGLLAFDFFFHVRQAHTPTLGEAARWSAVYVGLAVAFGIGLWVSAGTEYGLEYFAGYLTEKALSVDNLFVFMIIMAGFSVPRADQQKVLLFGIIFSLIARGAFIAVGVALISRFAWVFYLFGLILLVTAGNLLKEEGGTESHAGDTIAVRLAKRFIHTTEHYDGDKLFTVLDGRRAMTPMLLVMVAIGGTDILFALDSIPAIFGLTESGFIVFTATAFSLMGLRQLFFLIDGLLDRLIYLSYGLAAILAFIGVKLILHALHENNVPFINEGEKIIVVEISTPMSLTVIVVTLTVTVLLSLYSPKGKARTIINNVRRHTDQYLDLHYETDPTVRAGIYQRLLVEERQFGQVPPKYRSLIRDETTLLERLKRAHETHDQFVNG